MQESVPGGAPEDFYYPAHINQFSSLIGKLLTHVEAMGLTERAEKANKDLIKQSLWGWWNEVVDNSKTSYRGCIAPIQVLHHTNGTERKYVWHADGDHAVSVS